MNTRKSDKPPAPPAPVVPSNAVAVAKIGGTVALGAAAAISAQSLISLGHLLGLHGRVAWLLPTSLDVYAATSIWVGYRIPAAHSASAIARRGARLALVLTVSCNALYHLLLLAGHQMPSWLTDGLLVLVGALPPLVVERIFHLQMAVREGKTDTPINNNAPVDSTTAVVNDKPVVKKPESSTPSINNAAPSTTTVNASPAESTGAVDSDQPVKPPAAKPKPATKSTGDDTTNADEIHAAAMRPVYEEILERTGKRPTAPELHRQVPGIGSVTRAQQIRALVEERWHPEMARPRFQVVEGGEPLQQTG